MYSKEEIKKKLHLGLQYHKNGNIEQAQTIYEEILQEDPDNPDAWHLLGDIARQVKRHDLAEEFVLRSIEFSKSDKYFITLGKIYFEIKDFDTAVCSYKESLKLNSGNAAVFNSIGNVFSEWKKHQEAESYYKKSLEINPKQHNVFYNLGNAFLYQNKVEKAISAYQKALELNPNYTEGLYGLGLVNYLLRNFKEGDRLYQKAVELKPEGTEILINYAVSNLLQEDFQTGWDLYERARLSKEKNSGICQEMLDKRWKKQDIQGKKIYLYHEQGIGDTIFSLRYLPVLQNMGAEILIQPQRGLENIIKENFKYVKLIDSTDQAEEEGFDFYSPLYHLTCILKQNLNNIPFIKLKADEEKILFYKKNYFSNTNKLKIGLIWQGNPDFMNDRNRSLPLEFFYDLLTIPEVKFYSFQCGFGIEQLEKVPTEFEILDIGSSFRNFSDTAAALENIDLLITIDSAVAHIAGSLEKPTIMLIPSFPDWRWRLEGENCIWYKNLKIFRQESYNNWGNVKGKLINAIKSTVNDKVKFDSVYN